MDSEKLIKNLSTYIDHSNEVVKVVGLGDPKMQKVETFKETMEESINAVRERDHLKAAVKNHLNAIEKTTRNG